MKKKVLFVFPSYNIGGTTLSTLNLISLLDSQKYEITIWALSDLGILKEQFKQFSQIKTCFPMQALFMPSSIGKTNLTLRAFAKPLSWLSVKSRWFKEVLFQYAIKVCLKNNQFDTVVACQEGGATQFVSLIDSPNRIAWIRCDYMRYLKMIGKQQETHYQVFNNIVCVAQKSATDFCAIYPDLADKTICIHNPQNDQRIIDQSKIIETDPRFLTDKTVIISIGRFDSVKRFEKIPLIASQLVKLGVDFRWYVIGGGGEQSSIEEAIEKNAMSERVILLGSKTNPYYYLSNSDLLVCLSSSEACPRVINESKILGTPVVSTDFVTVYDYITNGKDGLISSIENITEKIFLLLSDKELYNHIKKESIKFKFDNSDILEKINQIL